ncbi:endoplasmic reticulum Oxidoreductin 1-domain-containing protein [Delphinella strobiligena]|nr:endoplasmic reticulum Oxidoreductin 1-domain-containing protein [Delphinella strobiligena]
MRKSAAEMFFLAVFALLGPAQASSSTPSKSVAPDVDVCAVSLSLTASRHQKCATSRPNDINQINPGATVSDACASYADLDKLNSRLNPFVKSLCRDTDFFSYYRLNLYNKVCPFWSDENGLCGNIACAVSTIDNEEDIPKVWRAEELSRLEGPKAQHPGKKIQKERPQKPLMGELGENVGESCVVEYDDECDERDYCVPEDEDATAKGDYVSLVENPERFTGYSGEDANQVWEAIYHENCFSKPASPSDHSNFGSSSGLASPLSGPQGEAVHGLKSVLQEHGRKQAMRTGGFDESSDFEDECLEKRVFYRVISGMHASISTHLCYDYLNQSTGQWGPNLQCYKERLHAHPERLSNLYFNFAFVSRAVSKLKDYVQDYTFCTGDPQEDRRTKQMIIKLAQQLPAGSEIFDETVMFQDNYPEQTGITLKEDFRNRFRNVSRIMDCVGCDKCRLWGKLQTNGFGTALKVLFEFGDNDATKPKPTLRRTELVALINTLDKISHALKAVGEFREMIEQEQREQKLSEKAATMTGEEDDDEEDLTEFNNPDTHTPKRKKLTTWQATKREFRLLWRATIFILKSWVNFPKTMLDIIVVEITRVYQRWLGLEVMPRIIEFKFPNIEDLYEDVREL